MVAEKERLAGFTVTTGSAVETGEKTEQEQQKKKTGQSNSPDYKADPSGSEEEKEGLRSSTHANKYMDINKARLLLESMKNSEKQYIQQLPVNTTSKPNEPAW